MVVTAARAHEDGLAVELAGDDLEAEDTAVELGGPGRVPDEQDGVVEAGDRDAHRVSVRHRTPARHAVAGAGPYPNRNHGRRDPRPVHALSLSRPHAIPADRTRSRPIPEPRPRW